jgi:3-hydroxyisobutyrate dehydrogenase-like beta-hydroxyacid dehydrogenase
LIIGFIGFGELASTLTKKFKDNKLEVISSIKDRSEESKKLAKDSGVKLLSSYEEVAKSSDLLISAVTPSKAIDVAKKYGILTSGLFLDLNNISPMSTMMISDLFDKLDGDKSSSSNFIYPRRKSDKFIKGSVIGRVNSDKSVIYLSGFASDKLSFLSSYGLNIKILGKELEKAAYIKSLRSIYTKGTTAIVYEAFIAANNLGLSDELYETLAITEGDSFMDLAKSRLNNFDKSKDRKFQEMDEVLEFLSHVLDEEKLKYETIMTNSARYKFKG